MPPGSVGVLVSLKLASRRESKVVLTSPQSQRRTKELQTMAAWLGLGTVAVGTKGVLASVLRRQLSGMSWSPLES